MKHPIIEQLEQIASGSTYSEAFERALGNIVKNLDPETPSHEVSIFNLHRDLIKLELLLKEPALEKLAEEAVRELEERGFRLRGGKYTKQEHKLMGSTVSKEYEKTPYTPIGILEGELTIEEARKARQLAMICNGAARYFGVSTRRYVKFSLEPLDAQGHTIRDPRLVDEDMRPVKTNYSEDFPFKR